MIAEKTSLAWIAPYIDPGIAMILAIILLREPITMVVDSLKSLVLFAPKEDVMEKVRQVAESGLGKYGYRINFLDVTKTGRKLWVVVYILHDEDIIHISELKAARKEMTEILKKEYDSIYIDITPELDDIPLPESEESNLL